MSDFGLVSIRDLCAFIQLYRLNAYSARKAMEGDFSHNLDCLLEPTQISEEEKRFVVK